MKSLRNKTHFTQRELAELTGISQSAINHSEKGRRSLSSETVIKIAEIISMQEQLSVRKKGQQVENFAVNKLQLQKLQKQLKLQLNKAALDAVRYSQLLAKMQERYRQQTEKLSLILLMKKNYEPGSRQMTLLELLEIKAKEKIESSSPVRQAETRYQLLLCDIKQKLILEMQQDLNKIK